MCGALRKNNGKKRTASAILAAITGLLCAAVLGLLFYGAMVYQTPEAETPEAAQEQQEGGVLALAGAQLLGEQTAVVRCGGQNCTVLERTYLREGGAQARAITASPAAYMERLSQEGYVPQLITGFTLAGMDAVYALRGGECLLAARHGDTVYLIDAQADEQAVYALGAEAYLE